MNLSLSVSLLAGFTACTGVLLAPSAARACSCFGETRVAQTQDIAENAKLVMGDFCGGAEEALTITVDGQPATLLGKNDSVFDGAYLSAIDPPIVAGQTVVIEYGEEAGEGATTTLTVAAADTEPPVLQAPTIAFEADLEFDLTCSGGDPESKNRYTATLPVTADDDDVLYTFTMYFDGEMVSERSVGKFRDQPTVGTVFTTEQAPSEVCVDITAVDAAGNASELSGDCVEGPGGDDDKAGCGCTTDPQDGGWLGLGLAGLLVVFRRRRGASRRA